MFKKRTLAIINMCDQEMNKADESSSTISKDPQEFSPRPNPGNSLDTDRPAFHSPLTNGLFAGQRDDEEGSDCAPNIQEIRSNNLNKGFDISIHTDFWLDSDEDPLYEPSCSSPSDSEYDFTPKRKKSRKAEEKKNHAENIPLASVRPALSDTEVTATTSTHPGQIYREENNIDCRPIPYKISKKRKSVKGRSREVRMSRKEKRNTGKEYKTESGKVVIAKKWTALQNCRRKCKESLNDEDTKRLFDEFWNIGDYSKRVLYLSSLITTHDKMYEKKKVGDKNKQKNRLVTHAYHLKINGVLIQICKGCFIKIFDISNKFIEVVCAKANKNLSGVTENDCRGKQKPSNAIPENVIETARDHILSIPSYESHYSRRHTEKRYLPSHYTLAQMYREYKEKHGTQQYVSITVYSNIFHSLNLAIKSPKNDTCSTCDTLAMKIKQSLGEEKIEAETALLKHHELADSAYKSKDVDKEEAKVEANKTTLTFDLQQCLPTPSLTTSVVFYKRQLWTFNLTIHDSKDNEAHCYMWSEVDGGRGSNQIASCIAKHLTTKIPPLTTHVVMYSDTCGGQNKNSAVLAMCMSVLKNHESLETIDHKFLVPGHTHMECDAYHALIERKKKKSKIEVYHPHDWMQLVRQCGEAKKMKVTEMDKNSFFEYGNLIDKNKENPKTPLRMPTRNGKIFNDEGERFFWREVRWLRFQKKSAQVLYKTSFEENEPFKSISVLKRGHGKNKLIPQQSYKGRLPITQLKKKDLVSLLHLIPSVFHDFYMNLPTTNAPNFLPDIDEIVDEVEEVEVDK